MSDQETLVESIDRMKKEEEDFRAEATLKLKEVFLALEKVADAKYARMMLESAIKLDGPGEK